MAWTLIVGGLFALILSAQVEAHGRLISPPSRASAWRLNYNTPIDYNDNEGFCGGFYVQQFNGGKCGICGNNFADPPPRAHEAGGRYGTGTIVAHFKAGQVVKVRVEITANHKGYFVFKMCQNNNTAKDPSQECFDQMVLKTKDGEEKWMVPDEESYMMHDVDVKLPEGLSCSQCIFQWTYVAGNNVGFDKDGNECMGCGPQENFVACSDIKITHKGPSKEENEEYTELVDSYRSVDIRTPSSQFPPYFPRYYPYGNTGCVPSPVYAPVPDMGDWCIRNCGPLGNSVSSCPISHCVCG